MILCTCFEPLGDTIPSSVRVRRVAIIDSGKLRGIFLLYYHILIGISCTLSSRREFKGFVEKNVDLPSSRNKN